MRTILLVEDDQALASLAAEHLADSGYDVITSAGTMDALDILDSGRKVDLLLADIVMPRGQPNGVTLVRMAKLKRPEIKAALMTAYRDFAGDESTVPVFYKPLDLADLTNGIAAMLRSQARADRAAR